MSRVDGFFACLDGANAAEVAACGVEEAECSSLVECTAGLVDDVLPEQVTQTIDTVLECAEELDACVVAAATPAALAACGEDHAACVAGALDVTLPVSRPKRSRPVRPKRPSARSRRAA